MDRWSGATRSVTDEPLDAWVDRFREAGRLTLNFHPDRVGSLGIGVSAALLETGRYLSQWTTGVSAGSRSAVPGGERQAWESSVFDGAYLGADPSVTDHPVYGSLDLLLDPHGGSPRFGSSFVILHRHVRERTTLCLGDSHLGPTDIGTFDEPACVLAGLAEQAEGHDLLDRGLGIDDLLEACRGSYLSVRPARDLDGYIEAQVHGGVSLAIDVETIVVDPSFEGTEVGSDLEAAAERYQFELAWHGGSEIRIGEVPDDFRGPAMLDLARRIARPDDVIDARAIGNYARSAFVSEPTIAGDPPESDLQQVKYLWHTLLACGRDAAPNGNP